MSNEPTEDPQTVADLREALQHAVRLLCFSAGREAVADPGYAGRLMSAADHMTGLLARTR